MYILWICTYGGYGHTVYYTAINSGEFLQCLPGPATLPFSLLFCKIQCVLLSYAQFLDSHRHTVINPARRLRPEEAWVPWCSWHKRASLSHSPTPEPLSCGMMLCLFLPLNLTEVRNVHIAHRDLPTTYLHTEVEAANLNLHAEGQLKMVC